MTLTLNSDLLWKIYKIVICLKIDYFALLDLEHMHTKIYRRSYMSAHVLLNLLESWGKAINARLVEHFITFSKRV